jgi:hypothetical protein
MLHARCFRKLSMTPWTRDNIQDRVTTVKRLFSTKVERSGMFIVYAQRISARLLGLEPCRMQFEPPTAIS